MRIGTIAVLGKTIEAGAADKLSLQNQTLGFRRKRARGRRSGKLGCIPKRPDCSIEAIERLDGIGSGGMRMRRHEATRAL